MKYAIGLVAVLLMQEEVPFKVKEDFEIKFDLSFKQRTQTVGEKTVRFDETRGEREKRTQTGPLPYLKVFVTIINVPPEEVKLKVIKDDKTQIFSKKIQAGMELKLELGFTDDIKDKISGYKHEIQFLSADKKILSRILIEFDDDGNYFLNGEKMGKV